MILIVSCNTNCLDIIINVLIIKVNNLWSLNQLLVIRERKPIISNFVNYKCNSYETFEFANIVDTNDKFHM